MRWDAMSTPAGLAGYIRFISCDSCAAWQFRFYPRIGAWQKYFEMRTDSSGSRGPQFAVDIAHAGGAGTVSLEWVLPWDSLAVDSLGRYAVGVYGYNKCGDTLAGNILIGVHSKKSNKAGTWSGVTNQAILIVVLIALYAIVRGRSRKYMKPARRQ
jgi:hypothetical protein